MKTFRSLTLAAALIAASFTHATAFAEAIGGGSIRVTAAEPGTEIQIRYQTEQGTVTKFIAGTEVLHLSTFEIVDNGGLFPLLNPTQNTFNLYKDGSTGFVINGGSDDLVRLSFEQAGTKEDLQLDFQWTPKLEILTGANDKVEVLDESDQLLHNVGEDALYLISNNGMAIRFVIPEVVDQGGNDEPADQPAPPQAQASGGCSMAAGSAGTMSALGFLLPAVLVALRFRRK